MMLDNWTQGYKYSLNFLPGGGGGGGRRSFWKLKITWSPPVSCFLQIMLCILACLSVGLSVSWSVCRLVRLWEGLSVGRFVCGKVCLSEGLSVSLFFYHSVSLAYVSLTVCYWALCARCTETPVGDGNIVLVYIYYTPGTRCWSRLRNRTLAVKRRKNARKSAFFPRKTNKNYLKKYFRK